jgi:hypothetical protein
VFRNAPCIRSVSYQSSQVIDNCDDLWRCRVLQIDASSDTVPYSIFGAGEVLYS